MLSYPGDSFSTKNYSVPDVKKYADTTHAINEIRIIDMKTNNT